MASAESQDRVDIAVLGAGSAAEALVRHLDGECRVVVFEPRFVGGICPFVACMPSKSMLHDASGAAPSWQAAVLRRDDVVEHLDDDSHCRELSNKGVLVVREAAQIVDEHHVRAGDRQWQAEHIVIATGSEPVTPPIDGLDQIGDRRWTSDDALTTTDRPARLAILGAGVIGCELAYLFARFGTEVHLLDSEEVAFPDLHEEIGQVIDGGLEAAGVRVRRGRSAVEFKRRGGNVRIRLDNGATLATDRVIVATGRRARRSGLGLESLGLDPDQPLPVDHTGRVQCPGSVWAVGDVADKGQYTHLANHHGLVVANQLTGDATRRFDDVVTPACMFTDPPMLTVGPTRSEVDDDVVWATADLSEIARWSTDDHPGGFLAVAARRSTGTIIAAHGAGPKFDELVHALVVAIDGAIPVERLSRSILPFPTMGEILGPIYERLLGAIDSD
jgi:pyruvate/2-oxoglutarate dehydrogenase complex dihydrolipoamide dehydrogenase (E3) component